MKNISYSGKNFSKTSSEVKNYNKTRKIQKGNGTCKKNIYQRNKKICRKL